jgi:hypothetical protein
MNPSTEGHWSPHPISEGSVTGPSAIMGKQPTSLRSSDKETAESEAEGDILVKARNFTIRYTRHGWHEKRARKSRAVLVAADDTAES